MPILSNFPSGNNVDAKVAAHNTASDAHSDIRTLVGQKAASSDLTSHTGNKSNPHGVTKAQVGLGNVDNTADTAKPVSTAQATAIADAKKAGTDAQSNLTTHINDESNPHGVTAAQVGAATPANVSSAVSTHNSSTSAHSDIRTAVSNAQSTANAAIPSSKMGVASGVATLGTDGKVPAAQLPDMDYVTPDEMAAEIDVIEAAISTTNEAVETAQNTADSAADAAAAAQATAVSKAPSDIITAGTTDLTAGTSTLASGKFYAMY